MTLIGTKMVRDNRTAREIFEEVIAVASGKRTKSEELGYGDNEFVPWQIGAVM